MQGLPTKILTLPPPGRSPTSPWPDVRQSDSPTKIEPLLTHSKSIGQLLFLPTITIIPSSWTSHLPKDPQTRDACGTFKLVSLAGEQGIFGEAELQCGSCDQGDMFVRTDTNNLGMRILGSTSPYSIHTIFSFGRPASRIRLRHPSLLVLSSKHASLTSTPASVCGGI